MLYNNPTRVTQLFGNVTKPICNRTGATLAVGSLVALDLTGSDGSVETHSAYDPTTDDEFAHPFASAIAVGAAHDDGWPIVVALESIADDAHGECGLSGTFELLLVGSSGVTAGARLMATSGQVYASTRTTGQAGIGIALDAGATASTVQLGSCLFCGAESWIGNTD